MEDSTQQQGGQQGSTGQPVGGNPPADQGQQPVAGQPPVGQPVGQPPVVQPPAGQPQNDLSGIMEENVDISGLIANAGNQQQQQQFIASIKIPPHPNTQFNEQEFIQLLAGSISLTVNEKHRIVQAIAQLSQFQIDELIKIFREEQQKFAELEKKHAEQVAELEKQHASGSVEALEDKTEEETKKQEEGSEVDDIKKSLGL